MEPFSTLVPDAAHETPVLVEIPHAGVHVPAECLALLDVPARSLVEDADLYVDRLYEGCTTLGASMLVARLSRYVVDLNRSEVDIDGHTVEGYQSQHAAIRGVVWRESGRGERVLRRPLSRAELDARLQLYYRPYHRALQQLIEHKRQRFGHVIVVAAHSMPSRDERFGAVADVVPGTRGRSSAGERVIETLEAVTERHALQLRHDTPYRGGYTTVHYGRPRDGVHVVQVELARRLYMDEAQLTWLPERAQAVRAFCHELVDTLGRLG